MSRSDDGTQMTIVTPTYFFRKEKQNKPSRNNSLTLFHIPEHTSGRHSMIDKVYLQRTNSDDNPWSVIENKVSLRPCSDIMLVFDNPGKTGIWQDQHGHT